MNARPHQGQMQVGDASSPCSRVSHESLAEQIKHAYPSPHPLLRVACDYYYYHLHLIPAAAGRNFALLFFLCHSERAAMACVAYCVRTRLKWNCDAACVCVREGPSALQHACAASNELINAHLSWRADVN